MLEKEVKEEHGAANGVGANGNQSQIEELKTPLTAATNGA
jgi:hypothetical protein